MRWTRTDSKYAAILLFIIVSAVSSILIAIHSPVKAAEPQRFELIYKSDWIGSDVSNQHVGFTVFHDKVSGQEITCAMNDLHFNPTCFPSGRNWK